MGAPRLPLRVGRDTRTPNAAASSEIAERRARGVQPNNDLYLRESGTEIFVSREHFLIEQVGGEFRLVDRKSTLGTWVEGRLIGGDQRGGEQRQLRAILSQPEEVTLGRSMRWLG